MPHLKRVDIGDDGCAFDVTIDGVVKFKAVRETLDNGRHGCWLLHDAHGWYLDSDQYSNDLLERVSCGHYGVE